MEKVDDKNLEEWKKSFAKMGIVYETDKEYHEAFNNLVGFFDTLIQIDLTQKSKSKKRKEG